MSVLVRAPVRRPTLGALVVPAAAVLAGLAVASGYWAYAVVSGIVAGAFLVGLRSWRTSVVLLLAYLPVSGIAIVAAYPHTGPANLVKDVLFVLPAYAGFLGAALAAGRLEIPRGLPIGAFVLFVALIVGETLTSDQHSFVARLIAVKVWLFYVPLVVLGYHWVRDRRDLDRLLALLLTTAMLPAVVGLAEAAFVYGGNPGLVYRAYGSAASAVTQNFAAFPFAGTSLRRLPSTFAFLTQYYGYLVAMIAVAYACWRGATTAGARSRWPRWAFALLVVASFVSGARGAFIFVPLLVLGIAVLEGSSDARRWLPIAALVGGLLLATALLGAGPHAVLTQALDIGSQDTHGGFLKDVRHVLPHVGLGHGTGTATSAAARYSLAATAPSAAVTGVSESYWIKGAYELGFAGLVVLAALFAQLSARVFAAHRRLRDPQLRIVSAALVAYLLWHLVYAFKGSFLDFDPTNVYFWLFAGVLLRLPDLEGEAAKA